MAAFVLVEKSPLSPTQAWERITDWVAHGQHVPLTKITVDPPGASRVGTVFTARTAVGPIGFDDPMEVVEWQPPVDGPDPQPGHCRLEKRGRVMLGWAEISVTSVTSATSATSATSVEPAGAGSQVSWREEAVPAHLPRFAHPVAAVFGRLLFARVMRKLLG